MTTLLKVYNGALTELGSRQLSSAAENIESRRVLDVAYDDCVEFCLAKGQWNFATRTIKLDSDTGITTNFGFAEVFSQPTDFVRTVGLSGDAQNDVPLGDEEYKNENGYFFSDITPIYLRYVSNGASYGTDLTKWPGLFTRYVQCELATRVCKRITGKDPGQALMVNTRRALRDALGKDAMDGGTVTVRSGRLVSARAGPLRTDRGSRSRLIG